MGLLDQVVTTGHDLNVLHGVEHGKFPKRCTVAPELVGVNDFWHIVFSQQPTEEQSSSLGIAVLLKKNVQHGSVLIDGPPQPVVDPAYVHVHFVEVPPRTPTGFSVAQALREEVTEVDAPGANGFASHTDAPFAYSTDNRHTIPI